MALRSPLTGLPIARCLVRVERGNALFGADADAWPKDYLCRPCHEEWHESVTPQLLAREAS